jgi:hypothetical protein
MSNPTSNFNWQMPTATDLVTDLPADFEVFGQAVDTALADLKGGTTNQVLAKNSNTDMDFKWVADAAGMTNPMTTTGDTIYSSSGSTPARLGIGTAGQVLQVNSGATAPEWGAPAGFDPNFQLINAGGTNLTGANQITVSGISGKKMLAIKINSASSASASSIFTIRFNSDSGNNYTLQGLGLTGTAIAYYTAGGLTSEIRAAVMGAAASNTSTIYLWIDGTNTSGIKPYTLSSVSGGSTTNESVVITGTYEGTSAITSITIFSSIGNFDAGSIFVYGA